MASAGQLTVATNGSTRVLRQSSLAGDSGATLTAVDWSDQAQVIANLPVTVSTNVWYDLRLEVIGNNIRAFVNGDLKIEASDSTIATSGRSGVLMYRTSADLWQYITYQP